MRFDRVSPPPEPIHIEFYGSDEPGLRRAIDPVRDDEPPSGVGRTVAAVVAVALMLGIGAVAVNAAVERAGPSSASGEPSGPSPAAPAPGESGTPQATILGANEINTLPPVTPSPLPFPGGAVATGRYRTHHLGLPVEFTLGEATALRTARPGTVVLTPVGTVASNLEGTAHVQFIRVGGWNTREEARDRTFRGVGSIPGDDIEAWIAANDVIVDRRATMLVDGREATVIDLHVDPASPLGEGICSPAARPCFWYASVAEAIIPYAAIRLDYQLTSPMVFRMWLIPIAGADPLLVRAAAVAGDDAWLDGFEAATVATMTIGSTAVEDLAGSGSGVPAAG